MWDTELILSVVNNEKYTKPTIAASCKALEQCWA
jgi:hypothetical protein